MPIAFSQTTTALNSGGSATTHNFSANGLGSVTAVTDGIAFVLYDSGGTGINPTSVTWGGVAMAMAGSVNQTTRGNTQSLWYLFNPASGAVTISDTFAAANTPNMIWAVYSGVSNNSIVNIATGSTTVSNNLTVTVNTLYGDSWLVGAFTNNLGVGVAGANTTSRFSNVLAIGDTNASIQSMGPQSQSWSLASSTNWTGIVCAITTPKQKGNNLILFS